MKKLQITLVMLLVLIGVLVGVLAYYTHGFSDWTFGEEQKPSIGRLSLFVNGNKYAQGDALPFDNDVKIEVEGVSDYSVEIVPGNASFDFRHNGALVKFPYLEGNFNNAFAISADNGFFSINGKQRSIKAILETVYKDEEITDISAIDEEAIYFVVRVSGDGQTVDIPINGFYAWMSIELDKPEIIF